MTAALMNWCDAHHLLPNAFAQGFLLCAATSQTAPSYLAGEVLATGRWYYYPFAILVKTPVPFLVLILGGLASLRRRQWAHEMGWHVACVLLPPLFYLGFAMTTSINIGLRHVLPVYPFFVLLAAMAAHEILSRFERRRLKVSLLAGAIASWAASFAGVYPHTLTFFNWIVGGPENGPRYLADSNLDWGQHLKALKDWMDEHGVARINLAYFGTEDPADRMSCVILPGATDYLEKRIAKPELPGYVAISETVASGVYLRPEWREWYSGFDNLEPVAVIGNTIKVFHIESWPGPAPADDENEVCNQGLLAEQLRRRGWPEFAAIYYREYLYHQPNDIAVHRHLALVQAALHHPNRARNFARRAVELARTATGLRGQLAMRLLEQHQFADAIEPAQTLAGLLPDQPAVLDTLGVALAGSGRLAEARAPFEAAVKLAPTNENFRQHLKRVLQAIHAMRH